MFNSYVSGRRIPGREKGKINFVFLLKSITLIQLYFRDVETKDQVIFYSSILPFLLKRCMFIVTLTPGKIDPKLKQNIPYPSVKNKEVVTSFLLFLVLKT